MLNFSIEPGFHRAPFSFGDPTYQAMAYEANAMIEKSFTTGEGIVPAGIQTGGDGRPLRVQYLDNKLREVSFEQDDAGAMKVIPFKKVYSNTFEWSQVNQYGGPGNGFTGESGFETNQFSINASDDIFARLLLQVKYMCAVRNVSLPSTMVRSLEDPEKLAVNNATLELVAKCNTAIYWGDNAQISVEFAGLVRQMFDWLNNFSSSDYGILWDAGGGSLDKNLLEDIAVFNRTKYGRGDMVLCSAQSYGDAQKNLFPAARFEEGMRTGSFGNNKDEFSGPYGQIKLVPDVMLRASRPLLQEGFAVTGAPRDSVGRADIATTYSANPVAAASLTSVAAGAGNFWNNAPNFRDGALAAVPAFPAGQGQNLSRILPTGNYWYAVAPVVNGKEGLPVAFGTYTSFAANTIPDSAFAGVANLSAANVVRGTIDATKLTSVTDYSTLQWRIYRYGGIGAAAPTAYSQFSFLMTTGTPSSGSVIWYDNGMYIPGSDNAFFLTRKKNGSDGLFLAQLMPLMRRLGLPEFVMGTPIAMLLFCCVVLLVPRHHIWIRNLSALV